MPTGHQCTQPSNKKYNHALYALHILNKPKRTHVTSHNSNSIMEKVGIDYFSFAGKDYLLIMDYFYSKYPEVVPVQSKIAEPTIAILRSIFIRHGISK